MYIPQLNIGSLQLETPVVLAPLANISDSPFRQICRRLGAGLVYTEMVSAQGLVRNSKKTWDLAKFDPLERPIAVQIFGSKPEVLAEAARRLDDLAPDSIDVNFGCPARKILKTGAGASFMEDPVRVAAAVHALVSGSSRPVSVKLRSGPDSQRLTVIEAARCAEAEGAAAITVHARTTKQGFSGRADWDVIAQVKAAVRIPVIGNGDVISPDDMLRMFQQTGCDGVMIGRGALGNPWIFAACRAALAGRNWSRPHPEQIWSEVERHYLEALRQRGPWAVREMRKHLAWYCKGRVGSAEFRARVFRVDDPDEALKISREFFLT